MQACEEDVRQWTSALLQLPERPDLMMDWVRGPLHAFFPFDRLYMCHGHMVAGEIKISHSIAHGHSQDYLLQLNRTFELSQRGSLAWWVQNRSPFLIDPDAPPSFATPYELLEIKEYSLKNVAAHGVLNIHANAGTYFSFAGLRTPLGPWHLGALKLIAPVLHDLFVRHVSTQSPTHERVQKLTTRQLDIVRLAANGLDNKSIGNSLGLSEKTVRNQMTEIFEVLETRSRTHLVALLK